MKISDLYNLILSNGDIVTGPLDYLTETYPDPRRILEGPRPVVTLGWLSPNPSFYAVDFATYSVGTTLKTFPDKASAEKFRDEILALDVNEFRDRFFHPGIGLCN